MTILNIFTHRHSQDISLKVLDSFPTSMGFNMARIVLSHHTSRYTSVPSPNSHALPSMIAIVIKCSGTGQNTRCVRQLSFKVRHIYIHAYQTPELSLPAGGIFILHCAESGSAHDWWAACVQGGSVGALWDAGTEGRDWECDTEEQWRCWGSCWYLVAKETAHGGKRDEWIGDA